jgi:hypothetical protein
VPVRRSTRQGEKRFFDLGKLKENPSIKGVPFMLTFAEE